MDIEVIEPSPKIPKVVEQIRKPEARSLYSDVLASMMRVYLSEIFSNTTSPIDQALTQRKGLVLFEGSVLRGTATEETHDFDLFTLVDDTPMSEELFRELTVFVRDIESHHPGNQSFAQFLTEKMQADSELIQLYASRVNEVQRRTSHISQVQPVNTGVDDISARAFIHLDTNFNSLSHIIEAIASGSDTVLGDTPSRVVVSLLTTTPDLVYELTSGALSYYQRRIVESLIELRDNSPDIYSNFYSRLEKDFANLHRSTSWRYPLRDFRLLTNYYLQSGRFSPQHISKEVLTGLISRHLAHKTVAGQYHYYLGQFDAYQKDPQKLIVALKTMHGIEMGLNEADIARISKGEDVLANEIAELTPEARNEMIKVERMVVLLSAIRRQMSFPTLEQLKEAYIE